MTDGVLTDYIAVQPDARSQELWCEWLLKNDITKQTHQGTHITIAYSKTRCDLAALFGWTSADDIFTTTLKMPTPLRITPKDMLGWEQFGKEGEYLVMLVKHPTLHHMHRNCLNMGATTDFPDYKPHITIDESRDDIDKDLLTLPEFDMVFDTCQITREYMVSDF